MRTGRAYVIIWLDHRDGENSDHAWQKVADIDSPSVPVRTVGYVVKLTRYDVVVAHTMDDMDTDDEPCSTTPFTIVRKAIVSCTEIPLPKIPKEFLPKPAKKESKK